MKETKKCIVCNLIFEDYVSNKRGSFCSLSCYWISRKNNPKYPGYWNGKKRSKETIEKLRLSKLGKTSPLKGRKRKDITDEKHPFWKDVGVSYDGLHKWINRKLGKPITCDFCLKTNLYGKNIHWANKSKEYRRDISDWIRLCAKCHKKYDKK